MQKEDCALALSPSLSLAHTEDLTCFLARSKHSAALATHFLAMQTTSSLRPLQVRGAVWGGQVPGVAEFLFSGFWPETGACGGSAGCAATARAAIPGRRPPRTPQPSPAVSVPQVLACCGRGRPMSRDAGHPPARTVLLFGPPLPQTSRNSTHSHSRARPSFHTLRQITKASRPVAGCKARRTGRGMVRCTLCGVGVAAPRNGNKKTPFERCY